MLVNKGALRTLLAVYHRIRIDSDNCNQSENGIGDKMLHVVDLYQQVIKQSCDNQRNGQLRECFRDNNQ